ncbi:hypothetical protein D3C87_1566750 [compost metagenome]
MVSAGEGDHAGTASSGTGNFHGVFYSFGTGGDQQGFLGEITWHLGVDFLAQLNVRLVSQHLEAGVGQLVQLFGHGGDDFRVHVAGVQYRDAAGEVDEFATFNVRHGGVLRRLSEDRVNLADTTWNSCGTTGHQFSVSLAHYSPHSPLIGRRGSRIKREKSTVAACDDRLPRRSWPQRKFRFETTQRDSALVPFAFAAILVRA